MQSIFVIVQKGVYRHEITCWSRTIAEAVELAVKRIEREEDGYHVFEVVEVMPMTTDACDEGEVVAVVMHTTIPGTFGKGKGPIEVSYSK